MPMRLLGGNDDDDEQENLLPMDYVQARSNLDGLLSSGQQRSKDKINLVSAHSLNLKSTLQQNYQKDMRVQTASDN